MVEHLMSNPLQDTGTVSDPATVMVAKCPNCDAPIEAPYCGSCGQLQKNINRQIWSLAGDLLDELFRIDSRIAKTLFALFFRPGFLTTEYFAGRRARYTPPLRLYLVISFLFFFLLPAITDYSTDLRIDDDQEIATDESGDGDVSFKGIELPWLSEQENADLDRRVEAQIVKARDLVRDDPSAAFGALMDRMSAVMFFMLPVFAIFLKTMYLGSGVYYAEHLLLAVHNHCFMYIALLLSAVMDVLGATAASIITDPLDDAIMIWIAVYMFISLKTAFGQSFGITLLKYLVLALIYFILTITGVIVASFIGLMSL